MKKLKEISCFFSSYPPCPLAIPIAPTPPHPLAIGADGNASAAAPLCTIIDVSAVWTELGQALKAMPTVRCRTSMFTVLKAASLTSHQSTAWSVEISTPSATSTNLNLANSSKASFRKEARSSAWRCLALEHSQKKHRTCKCLHRSACCCDACRQFCWSLSQRSIFTFQPLL